jgi:hypothetical protein
VKFSSVLLLLVLPVLAINEAPAQSPKAASDETLTDRVKPVTMGNRSFTISPSYVLEDMTAGCRNSRLTVAITAPSTGPGFLELKGLPVITDQDAVDLIKITPDDSEDFPGVIYKREYYFYVNIDPRTEPRRYLIRMALALPGATENIEYRQFNLNVGVNSGGKLTLVPPAENSQVPSFETGFFSGQKHTYQLNLKNSFADYTVSIESIKIHSDPAGLIKPNNFVYENGISLTKGEHKTIPLEFETTALSLRNLLQGLGTTPRIEAEVFYNDGNRRRITDFKPRLAINILPNNLTLVGAVFLGLLVGALIRIALEFKVFGRKVTTTSVLKAVGFSLLFGLALVGFVVIGQIEIKTKTLSMSSSYDNPLVMFTLGVIGALAGLQMIISWYKSFGAE